VLRSEKRESCSFVVRISVSLLNGILSVWNGVFKCVSKGELSVVPSLDVCCFPALSMYPSPSSPLIMLFWLC